MCLEVNATHTHMLELSSRALMDAACARVSPGKWAYEVLISSQGLMQIGWCTLSCRFNQEVSTCTRTSTVCMGWGWKKVARTTCT